MILRANAQLRFEVSVWFEHDDPRTLDKPNRATTGNENIGFDDRTVIDGTADEFANLGSGVSNWNWHIELIDNFQENGGRREGQEVAPKTCYSCAETLCCGERGALPEEVTEGERREARETTAHHLLLKSSLLPPKCPPYRNYIITEVDVPVCYPVRALVCIPTASDDSIGLTHK